MTYTLASGAMEGAGVGLLVVLACAGVIALLMARLKVAALPAYLVGGAIIGPSGFGLGAGGEALGGLAQLATVMLMFGIGLHLDLSAFRKGAAATIGAGFLSTLAVAGVAAGGLVLLGLDGPAAVAIGMAVSMSSTAVVLKQLQTRRELGRVHGRLIFGVLLVQDLLVIVMLAMLPALAAWKAAGAAGGENGVLDAMGDDPAATLQGIALRLAGVALLVVVGKLGLPRLFNYAIRNASPEVTLVLGAAAALAAAVASTELGLSAELGAFLAGFLLAATPVRFQLSGQVGPLRDLFMAVFFTVVGMQVDLMLVLESWWLVLLAALVVVVVKGTVIALSAWAVGASSAVAARTGVALAQAGEFTLVLLAVAVERALLNETESGTLIAVVVATLIAAPALMGAMHTVGGWVASWPTAPWIGRARICEPGEETGEKGPHTEDFEPGEHPEDELFGHVIIAGFGPVGRACHERLDEADLPVVIIELNARTVANQLRIGRRAVYGDASNAEVLERAGLHAAAAVVLTIPDDEQTLRACRTIRSIRPDVVIAARTATLSRANLARQQGVDEVVVEEMVTAREMSACLLRRFAKPDGSTADPTKPEPTKTAPSKTVPAAAD